MRFRSLVERVLLRWILRICVPIWLMMVREGMEKSDPYVSFGMVIVLMSCIFLAGVRGRVLMSSSEILALAARVFWIALRWALVVLMANPSVLKVVVRV